MHGLIGREFAAPLSPYNSIFAFHLDAWFAPSPQTLVVDRSIMIEFNGSDAGPLGVGDGCVQPRDGKQVRADEMDMR